MLAALVAARAALGKSDTPLQYAVICAAAMPKPYEPLLLELRNGESSTALPTLHCLSKADNMNPPELGEAVVDCFTKPPADVIWHDAGHQVPKGDCLAQVATWMQQQYRSD
jgi:predicted esterase